MAKSLGPKILSEAVTLSKILQEFALALGCHNILYSCHNIFLVESRRFLRQKNSDFDQKKTPKPHTTKTQSTTLTLQMPTAVLHGDLVPASGWSVMHPLIYLPAQIAVEKRHSSTLFLSLIRLDNETSHKSSSCWFVFYIIYFSDGEIQ